MIRARLSRNDVEGGLELLREAVAIADGTGDVEHTAKMRVLLAEGLLAAGRREDAEAAVAAAVELAERKENQAMAERARGVLT